MPDPKQQEVLKQINDAWEHAKAQLTQLRQAVEKTAAMAQAKIDATYVGRERDRALRDLGEAVWGQVKAARMSLPSFRIAKQASRARGLRGAASLYTFPK